MFLLAHALPESAIVGAPLAGARGPGSRSARSGSIPTGVGPGPSGSGLAGSEQPAAITIIAGASTSASFIAGAYSLNSERGGLSGRNSQYGPRLSSVDTASAGRVCASHAFYAARPTWRVTGHDLVE